MDDHAALIRDVHRFQNAAFAGTGLDETLPPPATEEEIAAAEAELGFELPPDLKALYRFCRGGLPLGPHHWSPIDMIGARTHRAIQEFELHYQSLEPLPLSKEGPAGHKFVCVQLLRGASFVMEVGNSTRLWEYHVHSIDAPFIFAAASLSDYWSALAWLAERGWYVASDRVTGVLVPPFVSQAEGAITAEPAYLADLETLGLDEVDYFL